MKIAILGFGIEGRQAYDYWTSSNDDGSENDVTICDQSESIVLADHQKSKLGPKYLDNLSEFDLIVRSPSLHPNDIVKANGPDILSKVTTSTNEFFKVCPTKNIIGITGTKGKGTTATLLTKLLEAAGHKVHLGGNIGNGTLELLHNDIQESDWVVLELSSYQLIDLKHSPHIAICLMISPEHLNWHQDMEEYVSAKANIFTNQIYSDIAIYFAQNDFSKKLAEASAGIKIPFFEEPGAYVNSGQFIMAERAICRTDEIKLIGQHNWQNICAALTAFWRISQDAKVARDVITSFQGLEHRLEPVKEVNGIKYYNDSFASAPAATVAAIEAITGPKTLIIGGFDRNIGLDDLVQSIKAHEAEINTVILIGASQQRVGSSLQSIGFNNFKICDSKSMKEIVDVATSSTKPGGSVVLSPGFPSFDMFKNFEDRGLQYKEVINSL